MKTFALFIIGCRMVLTVFVTVAAPPHRSDLPASPAWVMHLDCDALRKTYIGQYCLYHIDKPEMKSNVVAFQSIFGFDLRTQLHGLSIYSEGPALKDLIIIIYADFEPDRVIATVKEAEAIETITHNRYVIYSWLDKNKGSESVNSLRNYAVIQNKRMIIGRDKTRMVAALNVLDGSESKLLTAKGSADLTPDGDGAFAQATARRLDFLGTDPASTLLKMSKQIKLQANEANENFTAVLSLEASDEAMAKQMTVAAQGLIALLGLQKDNPSIAKLADRFSIKPNGSVLRIVFTAPSTELIAALKIYFTEKGRRLPAAS